MIEIVNNFTIVFRHRMHWFHIISFYVYITFFSVTFLRYILDIIDPKQYTDYADVLFLFTIDSRS